MKEKAMNINLPRAFFGKEIIRAWRELASAKNGGNRRLSVTQFPKRYVHDEGPATRRTGQSRFSSVDLTIVPYARKKKYIFFGAETWEPQSGLSINIHDLELEKKYNSLALVIHFDLSGGRAREFNENNSPENIRRQVAEIVQAFLTALIKAP